MAKKKKVHWSKLPRPKLISMVKRLELQCARLKTQLAETRETKLLNERVREPAAGAAIGVDAPCAQQPYTICHDPAGLEYGVVHVTQGAPFPWERS